MRFLVGPEARIYGNRSTLAYHGRKHLFRLSLNANDELSVPRVDSDRVPGLSLAFNDHEGKGILNLPLNQPSHGPCT